MVHVGASKTAGLFSHRRKPVGKPLMSSVGIFWPSEAGTQPKQAPSPTHRPELRTSGSQIARLALV